MTDKQIMINGVDVSKCMFFNKNYKEDDVQIKNFCELQYISCKEFDCANCYFKKWKRKEQECEKLKEGYSELTDIVSSYMDDFTGYNEELGGFDIVLCVKELMEQLDQLKAEKDGLKTMLKDLSYENQKFCYQIEEQTKQLEPFKDEYFKGLDNVAIAKLAKKSIRITAENSKLEQTLTEIKEICNSVENIENINSLYDAKLSGMYLQANIILQKISECEI